MRLEWKADEAGLRFRVVGAEGILPRDEWPVAGELYAQILLLQELLDNGQASPEVDAVLLPHAEATRLSVIDQQLLDLPPPYPFDIRIDARGSLEQNSFVYELGFYAHAEGERLDVRRLGCIAFQQENAYLLSPEHLALCQRIDAFNRLAPQERSLASNLLLFAEVKELSGHAAAVLDPYLRDQEVIAPAKISLDTVPTRDGLELRPSISSAEGFLAKFDRFPLVPDLYTIEGADHKRKRVVFTEEQKQALRQIKKHRKVSRSEAEALLADPPSWLDPDVVDLDAFSKRVVELGYYKPKFYPFISPYKSEWIPGFIVEKSPEERRRISFKTAEELRDFEAARTTAAAAGVQTVSWDGVDIPLADAGRIAQVAHRQFATPHAPIQQEGKETGEGKVLIIAENVEEVGYREAVVVPTPEAFQHVYIPPPHLRQGFAPKHHQEEGIAWLQSLSENHTGALLADDMGLGKTFTVLSFLKWHSVQRNEETKPYLIVAPVSLLENWENEYNRFFEPSPPPITRLYGASLNAMQFEAEGKGPMGLAALLQRAHLCLTTYETLRGRQIAFAAVDWAVVVLDEAQRIKTPGTLVTNAAKALKADFKVAMTGTPVENTLVDLWCIMDFVAPGLLGSAKEFVKEYQIPLQKEETDLRSVGESLRRRLGLYLKRRLKQDVLGELPPKELHVQKREMPPAQRARYVLEIERVKSAQTSETATGQEVLRALHAMRAISDHPYLADHNLDKFDVDELIATSAKLQETTTILDQIRDRQEKVILFADRRETQRLLARTLRKRFGIQASIINGETPAGVQSDRSSRLSRQQTIDRFSAEAGFAAIIMSPLAAGVGLNITSANHVIHYARHWNPAKEDQATDRAYRIGQEKEVHVYFPMAVAVDFNSFDIVLDALLQRKRALAEASLFPTEMAEVRVHDLYADVFGVEADGTVSAPLSLAEADSLEPHLFEALVAALWQRQGYHIVLTPRSHDRGADVVAFSDHQNHLLQVKQSSQHVRSPAIGEVLAAKGYYERRYGKTFNSAVVTNGSFTRGAYELASASELLLFDRNGIGEILRRYPVSLRDVLDMERARVLRLE